MDDYHMLVGTIVFASFIILFMLYLGYNEVNRRVNAAERRLNQWRKDRLDETRRALRPLVPSQ